MARKRQQPSDSVTCKHCRRQYGAITYRHLRNIHDYDDEHPILEYKRRFHVQFALCPDGRRKLSKTKVDFWAKRGQHWTPRKVIGEIRRLQRRRRNLRCKRVPNSLLMAGVRYFGSWEKAIESAG